MTVTKLPGPTTPAAGRHPWSLRPPLAAPHQQRLAFQRYFLDTVRRERGEWTVGRAKPVFRRFWQSHSYRSTIRRHFNRLVAEGHLIRHGDGTPRIYYTVVPEGEGQ
ncbi:hypothetical protein ACFYUY_01840 [Kitasatospora sp. NPDC004745]|uniref:hypothetical protein n=1 Tax=Kitasatospora sp. NPDC004745 TaxID=3364019 RepID=UPI0036CE456E